jgi:hypothetical protein
MGLTFTGYNKSVTVAIPQEALDAQESSSAGALDDGSQGTTAPTQSAP